MMSGGQGLALLLWEVHAAQEGPEILTPALAWTYGASQSRA